MTSVVFTVLGLAAEEKVNWMVEFSATLVVPLAGRLLDTENGEVDEPLLGVEGVLVVVAVEALLLPQPARVTEKIAATTGTTTAGNNLRFMTTPLSESMEYPCQRAIGPGERTPEPKIVLYRS